MFDNAIASRDAGVNFLFLSGDTWSWQVRFEPGSGGGTSTLVGYKESWVRDPEQKTAFSLKAAGNIADAKTHYRLVTRGWKNLENDPASGIDERRPGMTLTGVQSSGVIRSASGSPLHGGLYPWADLVVTQSTHWIYDGTGMANGAKIPNVFGYEVDSTLKSNPEFDKWRKPGQLTFGALKQVSDGLVKGSSASYRAPSGAEVVAMGAIYSSWALDDHAWTPFKDEPPPANVNPVSTNYQKMISNVINRYSAGVAPVFDAGPLLDAGEFDVGPVADAEEVEKDAGPVPDVEGVDVAEVGAADTAVSADTMVADDAMPGIDATMTDDAGTDSGPIVTEEKAADDGCSCSVVGGTESTSRGALGALGGLGIALAIALRRRNSKLG
jgi:MYXO-CTERM domain-containing protein